MIPCILYSMLFISSFITELASKYFKNTLMFSEDKFEALRLKRGFLLKYPFTEACKHSGAKITKL